MFEQAELRGTQMGPNGPPNAKETAQIAPEIATSIGPVSCDTMTGPITSAIVIRVQVSGSDDLEHGTIRRALVLVTTLPLQV